MNPGAIVATHVLVACCAWVNGWLTGHTTRPRDATPATAPAIVDLAVPRAYDWTVDGDAHGPAAGCPDCRWRGWITIPDWALDPFVVDLVVDCPTCRGALR